MANIASAKKRARQNEKRRIHIHAQRSRLRTALKAVREALSSADPDRAREAYRSVASLLDRSARTLLIHPNTAARYKSRLNVRLKALVTSKTSSQPQA